MCIKCRKISKDKIRNKAATTYIDIEHLCKSKNTNNSFQSYQWNLMHLVCRLIRIYMCLSIERIGHMGPPITR